MKDGIKEILDYLRKYIDNEETGEIIESKHTMNLLLDYITNLQEENEYSNYCNKELRKKITNLEYKIKRLEEENTKLKELCDKYEEEHKTTFEEWKKDIKIINKLQEWLEENYMCEVLTKLNELKEKYMDHLTIFNIGGKYGFRKDNRNNRKE